MDETSGKERPTNKKDIARKVHLLENWLTRLKMTTAFSFDWRHNIYLKFYTLNNQYNFTLKLKAECKEHCVTGTA